MHVLSPTAEGNAEERKEDTALLFSIISRSKVSNLFPPALQYLVTQNPERKGM